MNKILVAVCLLCASTFAQPIKAKLDHVMIDVHDLAAAKDVYAHLGFTMSPGGRHPTGTENSSAMLNGGGYLELIAPYDPTLPLGRSVAEFLKQGDGASLSGLEIASAEQTKRVLTEAGLKIDGPEPGTIMRAGEKEPPPPEWWTIDFADEVKSRPLFLIQYVSSINSGSSITTGWMRGSLHPNSASNFSALLIAVRDPEKAALGYRNIGKAADREIPLPEFGAAAREIVLERGSILLLRATDPTGPTARRLKDRGEGILALRLAVEDLDQARQQIGARNVSKNRESVLVAPENAAGVWLQFQAVVPSGMHKEISLPKKTLATYTGTYQMEPGVYMTITLAGEQLLSELTGGQRKIPLFAEAGGKFFTKRMPARLEFVKGGSGKVTELILRQNGMDRPMKRLDDDKEAKRMADESAAQAAMTAQRIKDQRPAPGSEAALRRILEALLIGKPEYELLSPDLADFTRQNLAALMGYANRFGAIESLTFKRVEQSGADIYAVKFQRTTMEYSVTLEPDGKVASCRPVGY